MSRQHARPILLAVGSTTGIALPTRQAVSELDIQFLVQAHPECLPIGEIDTAFLDPVPICMELATPAGPIDNFMVTARGLPVLVECKLWRNPQARREVVGQVLDYAKELSRWTSADIDREVRRRGVPSLIEAVRAVHPDVDEADFNDALTRNLSRGRCLLLIVGDGIREGVEAIFEHLRDQAALQFSLGLVEMPIHILPDGSQLVLPRVLARTSVEVRRVIELPPGMTLGSEAADGPDGTGTIEEALPNPERLAFWKAYLAALNLDDAEQPVPGLARMGWLRFFLPVADKKCWIVVYRDAALQTTGLYLVGTGTGVGSKVGSSLVARSDEIRLLLGGAADLKKSTDGTPYLFETAHFPGLDTPEGRAHATTWLAERTNHWINVLRPLVRSIAADIADIQH